MTDWYRENARMFAAYPEWWVKLFSFDCDTEPNEILCGMNSRTFPSTHRWKDQHGTTWRRVGLRVFDFKQQSRNISQPPSGKVILVRIYRGIRVMMLCEVERAFVNSRATVGDNIAVGKDESIVSTNCGRAVLRILRPVQVIGGSHFLLKNKTDRRHHRHHRNKTQENTI